MSDMDQDGIICFAESLNPGVLAHAMNRIVDFVVQNISPCQIVSEHDASDMAVAALGPVNADQLPVVDRILVCQLENRKHACGWFLSMYATDLPTIRIFFDGPLRDLRGEVTNTFAKAVSLGICDLSVHRGSELTGHIPAVYVWAQVRANPYLRKGLERRGVIHGTLSLKRLCDGIRQIVPRELVQQSITVQSWMERGILAQVQSEIQLIGGSPSLVVEMSKCFADMTT